MSDVVERKARTEFNKLQKRLRRNVGNAIVDYQMVEEGDVIMACISGGKDSFAMLDILLNLRLNAPVNFDVIAVNMDQKQPGFPEHVLPEYFESIGVPYYIVDKDTYSVVREKIPEGQKTCGLCSRLRRGTLYAFAEKIGATKLALGHHMDDIVETLFLNMFHGSRLKAMPPKLRSDDKRNVVIRPLAYCREKDLIAYADHKQFPIIPCNLCGSQENLQRQAIKAMLHEWERNDVSRVERIFKSIQNVSPSQLADMSLFDFHNLPLDRSGERDAYDYEEATVSAFSTREVGVSNSGVQLVETVEVG
ncbi:tRNA 2-thiocytidine(32) synthetase TtcA [Pseudomaricurvus alkylphenolicus]|jgi:tRNA 2-thiocytidine biosynthesis protein TtcA|uniref:tRNA 2-thiocytidine(32) synthetase TtcA n=1 Tax=Pseudomaricurvus alkylphenolicus TaxID=1306991 RepID=UPI00141F6C4A|nr:tRNA 2-thiocytidine(32) synthetase TtcA [Pseudomaricurvus alkylphenolicus]NIB43280.1 tRNA 2-thiocytidine(32) synthetase TtcA [Pseudomaricurvus alkylphenolicus]